MMEYVHYGAPAFSIEMFHPIAQVTWWNKPQGGLWASPVDAKYGWKQWNEESCFRECSEQNAFHFTLDESAKVIHIRSVDDLRTLAQKGQARKISLGYTFEFEDLLKSGIDAIELHLSDESPSSSGDGLYWALYGWDCDSIIVMNPGVITPI